ncbi:peptide deformylase [Chloroflexota bacterium]
MVVLPIYHVPDPILKQKSKRVRIIDGSIQRLIDNMIETMHSANGVGLAAPQVGVPLRVIVIGIAGEEPLVLINPEVVRRKGERSVNEGCLSVPGHFGEIKRAESVTVKGLDLNGKKIRIRADELLAQVLEHEIDHINGVLYLDHLESTDNLRKIEPEETQFQV